MNKHLTKRLMGLLLALVVLLMSTAPATAFALEETEAAQPAAETISRAVQTQLDATIEQQVRAFAKSINKSNADDTAAGALATHGIAGGGKKLSVGKSHALTAALMNSEVIQQTLIAVCGQSIEHLQSVGENALYLDLHSGWATFGYYYEAYLEPEKALEKLIFKSSGVKGIPGNAYDQSLVWIAGSIAADMEIKKLAATADTITYDIQVRFWDRFDFSTSSGDGFKDLISGIGAIFFREFDWESTVSFQIQVSNTCTHSTGNYHWVLNTDTGMIESDSSAGYTQNPTTKFEHEQSNGHMRCYYELDQVVTLAHDKPWEMELIVTDPKNILFNTVAKSYDPYPSLMLHGRTFFCARQYEQIDASETFILAHTYCYGTELRPNFSFVQGNPYKFCLENRVFDDGTNMIYLTVYNQAGGLSLPTVALDTYYFTDTLGTVHERRETGNNGLSGMDFKIKYFGNATNDYYGNSYEFFANSFDLRIWENGVDGGKSDYFTSNVTKPTCTAQGYTTYTCSLCGYSYKDTYVSAKGHSYGGWTQVKAPNCTATGEEQRSCTTCKGSETRAVAALGHDVVHHPGLAPTCTEDGWSDYESCNRCDHSTYQVISAKGHDYGSEVTPPTCTEDGYTTHTCACGDSYIDDEVSAFGHDMCQWTVITEPFAGMDGEEQRSCTRCDHYETRPIEYTGNLLKLEGEDLLSQSTVYINGLPYPVITRGDEHFVELPTEEDCTMVTYTYHVGDPDDIHTQYPVGMKVYLVSDGEITYVEELDNLLQYSGSSIRVTGNKGIRMITSLYKDTKSALTGGGLAGFKLMEYGTVLAFAHEVEGDGDLVLGKPYSRSNYAYKRGTADPVFANSGNLTQYTNVLVGFNLDQCKEDIAMRPYIILENADGEQFTIYGGTIYRSIGYVAYQNRNVVKAGTAAYSFVWDIIHHVYGDRYDSDYKG